VIPTRKPPSGPPPSAGVLAKYAQAYARASGISEGRVRTWISYMITAGVLERSAGDGKPQFIIKGGERLNCGYSIGLERRRTSMSCRRTRMPISLAPWSVP
jgi:hypothetical protein